MPLTFPTATNRSEPVVASAPSIDTGALERAIEYARLHATPPERVAYDYANQDPWPGDPPEYAGALGPFPDRRTDQNGLVVHRGDVLAEWGDTTAVDHCFSVAKSFLSLVAGLAIDRGLIDDVTDRVGATVSDGGFDSPHNRSITWEQFLQGTSEWEGELFGKPDTVDRNRPVGREESAVGERGTRELREPGTYWEYNDVRINRLALALLRAWGKPLPRVLAHELLGPIGATRRWEWHGYHNSAVTVDGRLMKSVSGGGHWGGGLWMSSRDLARVGQLLLNRGTWDDTRLLSADWIDRATTPCPIQSDYGYLFWLNTDRERWPAASTDAFAAVGHGTNTLWVDPAHDLVVVLRWLDPENDGPAAVYRRLLAGLDTAT